MNSTYGRTSLNGAMGLDRSGRGACPTHKVGRAALAPQVRALSDDDDGGDAVDGGGGGGTA